MAHDVPRWFALGEIIMRPCTNSQTRVSNDALARGAEYELQIAQRLLAEADARLREHTATRAARRKAVRRAEAYAQHVTRGDLPTMGKQNDEITPAGRKLLDRIRASKDGRLSLAQTFSEKDVSRAAMRKLENAGLVRRVGTRAGQYVECTEKGLAAEPGTR